MRGGGSRTLVRAWYGVVGALVFVALMGQLVLLARDHDSLVNYFGYFTIQSNIVVLVMSVMIVVDPERGDFVSQVTRLAALTAITVTGVVYGGLIGPFVNPTGAELVFTSILHYAVPSLTVIGFLVVGPRVELRPAALAFMVWPACWLAYTMIRGAVADPAFVREDGPPSSYPYSFIDADVHSTATVIAYIAGVAVLLVAVASLYLWINRRLTLR
jgi:hypothetical protein